MRSMKRFLAGMIVALAVADVRGGEIDLGQAVVVVPDGLSSTESKAVHVLVDEVRKRSRIGWDTIIRWPTRSVPVIAVGPARLLDSFPNEYRQRVSSQPAGKEQDGFRIQTVNEAGGVPIVAVVGNDARGLLFGIGRLCAELRIAPSRVVLPGSLNLASAPKISAPWAPARLSTQDQFIRRLGPAAMGAIHPRAGRLRHECDRVDPAAVRRRCRQPAFSHASAGDDGGHVRTLRRLWPGRLDLVPGDGRRLLRSQDGRARTSGVGRSLQEVASNRRGLRAGGRPRPHPSQIPHGTAGEQAANLHRYHPNAQMWVSPQSFSREWLDEFLEADEVRADMARRSGLRPAGAREPPRAEEVASRRSIRSGTIPTSPTACGASIRSPTGMSPTRSPKGGR